MNKKWKIGEITDRIWAGDLVSKCEYICNYDKEKMIFYDTTFKCFRLVFWSFIKEEKEYILNGWFCAETISKLLKYQKPSKDTIKLKKILKKYSKTIE